MQTPQPQLTWGRRYLMCPPEHFDVVYEINPWMDRRVAVDREAAWHQWQALVATLTEAGAEVERMAPHPWLPDLVFTANAGLVWGDVAVASRFRDPERQGETAHDTAWFGRRGYRLAPLPPGVVQEGAGDALPFMARETAHPVLVAGHGIRSHRAGAGALARLLGVRVVPVELVDPRLYHLDLAFCPLGPGRALVVPEAFTAGSRRVLEALVPEPLVLGVDDALTFCANSVVVGSTVVMPTCPPAVGRRLEAWGYDVAVVPVTEFKKAGGAVRCLTLPLDMAAVRTVAAAAA